MKIAVDFDGVINGYKGWKGKGVFEDPVPETANALKKLSTNHTIIINTTRLEIDLVAKYMKAQNLHYDHINFNPDNISQHLHPAKVLADVYIDDRALRFNGNWSQTLKELEGFKPWWKE